jgi:putative SOS response-associated peptidase YedK
VPVERFYEPRYQSDPTGHEKAERWAIERQDEQPFTIAALYELSEQNGQLVRSMTMLTINADGHPLMQQFHAPSDEKRSVVVIPPELRLQWLTASQKMAHDMLLELRSDDYKTSAVPR